MTDNTPHDDGLRARDVLTIVIAGAALGVLFNVLQLSADPSRALTWVKGERKVVSLEQVSPAPQSTAPAPVAATTPDPAPAPAPATTATPASRDSAHAKPAAHAAKPGATPAATAPATTPATATAPTATAPAAADVPVIPDSRDPIQAGVEVVGKLYAAGAALFVDARSAEEFAEEHIAGATNLPFDDVFKKPALAKSLDPRGRPIVVYCGGGDCELSRNLAFTLLDAGYHRVVVFTGGLPAWKTAGEPVRTGAQP